MFKWNANVLEVLFLLMRWTESSIRVLEIQEAGMNVKDNKMEVVRPFAVPDWFEGEMVLLRVVRA